MLDIKFIRENVDIVKEGVRNKNYDDKVIDDVLLKDASKRELQAKVESLKAEKNKLNRDQIDRAKEIKIELKDLEQNLKQEDDALMELLSEIPNIPMKGVPVGKGEDGNVEIKKWGEPRKFDFEPKNHLDIGKQLGILDFETGAKVTGSQFYYLYGDGALLELALVQYAFNLLAKEGFIPVMTPDLAKSRYYLGTGYSPRGKEAQTYKIEDEDLGLIATAEVTLAGKHADEILSQNDLPIKYVGYSHCFRREAGAYGKYSKGLYRVHQFTKVEMFIYCTSEESNKFHEYILGLEEIIYQNLGLPYRVLEMCTGDLGAMATRKFDIEAWMPGRNEYGEVTSTSNCTDYQARNLNIKYKSKDGSTKYVHMLNGTAIATSRTPLAILENYQNQDGSVTIPEVLRPIMGKDKIFLPKTI
ncbi:MAG: serine--tRNA ligase [Patescibacteria group bacterium]|jgi:seryl-tRNA synthetase